MRAILPSWHPTITSSLAIVMPLHHLAIPSPMHHATLARPHNSSLCNLMSSSPHCALIFVKFFFLALLSTDRNLKFDTWTCPGSLCQLIVTPNNRWRWRFTFSLHFLSPSKVLICHKLCIVGLVCMVMIRGLDEWGLGSSFAMRMLSWSKLNSHWATCKRAKLQACG